MSSVPFISTPEALRQLAAKPHTPCQCSLQHCAGWESVSDAVWPAQHMTHVATLRDPQTDADRVKLHFEIRRQGKPVDPVRYLPAR